MMTRYGEAVLDEVVSPGTWPGLQSLDDWLLDATTRKTEREPTMMDRLVAEAVREPGPTRRWFLKAGLSIGAIAFMSAFPGAPVNAAGTTFFASTTGDNSDGTTWAKAKTTVTAGIAVCGTGDYLLVASTYSVTATAAVTWTPPAGGLAIISVTVSGASGFSAFTAGATEAVGAASAAFSIAGAANSSMWVYGVDVAAGTNASASSIVNLATTTAVNAKLVMETCTLRIPTTQSAATVNYGVTAASGAKGVFVQMRNCTFIYGSRTGSAMSFRSSQVELINPTFTFGATKPSPLFQGSTGGSATGTALIRDGDISTFTGAALFDVSTMEVLNVTMANLKLSATPTLTTGTWVQGNGSIFVRDCDSANTDYQFTYVTASGTLTGDATVSKTSGATFNGTAISWKIVTSSLCTEFSPFVTPWLPQIWDATTSAQTGTVSVAQVNGATNLTDRTAWISLDYAASATATNYTHSSGRSPQPFVGTGTAWTADGGSWTGATLTGSGTPVLQLLNPLANSGTFSAARAGLLQGRVFVTTATLTLWVNPKIDGVT